MVYRQTRTASILVVTVSLPQNRYLIRIWESPRTLIGLLRDKLLSWITHSHSPSNRLVKWCTRPMGLRVLGLLKKINTDVTIVEAVFPLAIHKDVYVRALLLVTRVQNKQELRTFSQTTINCSNEWKLWSWSTSGSLTMTMGLQM